jgi:hypothetical protein
MQWQTSFQFGCSTIDCLTEDEESAVPIALNSLVIVYDGDGLEDRHLAKYQ